MIFNKVLQYLKGSPEYFEVNRMPLQKAAHVGCVFVLNANSIRYVHLTSHTGKNTL
jgi:hypothetical protein